MEETYYRVSYLQDSIEFLIEDVLKNYTFVEMMKELSEYMQIDLLRDDCHFTGPLLFNGDYQQWLEHMFQGVHRLDRNRSDPGMPPDIHWYLTLRPMEFKISERMGVEMLVKDLDYWKLKLKPGRDRKFPITLSFNPLLDLTENVFKIAQQ